MEKLVLTTFFLMASTLLQAASFIHVPLEGQLKYSDAIVQGVVNNSESKMLPNNEIVTEVSLKLSHYAGLNSSQLIYPGNFKILVPGGVWNGMVQSVSGAPDFSPGEKVMVFLKNSKYGFHVSSLSLGKYRSVKEGIDEHWQSVVFPEDKELGRITKKKLDFVLNDVFGAGLSEVTANFLKKKSVNKPSRAIASTGKRSRTPSSINEGRKRKPANKKTGSSSFSLFWLVILFAVLAAYKTLSERFKRE